MGVVGVGEKRRAGEGSKGSEEGGNRGGGEGRGRRAEMGDGDGRRGEKGRGWGDRRSGGAEAGLPARVGFRKGSHSPRPGSCSQGLRFRTLRVVVAASHQCDSSSSTSGSGTVYSAPQSKRRTARLYL